MHHSFLLFPLFPAAASSATIVTSSLVLVGLIVAGWVTVWQVRRRMTQPDEGGTVGFTLSDLRRLHSQGQMTDAEFERAKAKVVEAARRASAREQEAAAAKQARPRPRDE